MKYIFIVGFISLSLLAQDPDPPPLTSELVADIFTLTLINYRQPSRSTRGENRDKAPHPFTTHSPVAVEALPRTLSLPLSAAAMPPKSAPAAGDWILKRSSD